MRPAALLDFARARRDRSALSALSAGPALLPAQRALPALRALPARPAAVAVLAAVAALALAALAGCGDQTSVVVTFTGGAALPGDALCVAVTAGGQPAFEGRFDLEELPLPQTLSVAAGSDPAFSITAAVVRRGRELARSSRRIVFDSGSIGAAQLDLGGCRPNARPPDYRAVALLDLPPGPGRVIAAADLDADGRPDLVVAAPDELRLLFGRGAGTFADQSQERLPPGAATAEPGALLAADVDGDCRLDLVVADRRDGARWLRNLGEGRFEEAQTVAPGGVQALDAGDVNGDGELDLVLVGAGGDRVAFGPPPFQVSPLAPGGAASAALGIAAGLGDLDGDAGGELDLAVVASAGQVRTYANDGQGNLEPFDGAPAQKKALAAGLVLDLSGDNLLDVVIGGPEASTWLLLDRGQGTLEAVEAGLPPGATLLASADLDGDCSPDVLVSDASGLRLFGNPARGTRLEERVFPSLGPAEAVAAGDFDGDGDVDLAILDVSGGGMVLLR